MATTPQQPLSLEERRRRAVVAFELSKKMYMDCTVQMEMGRVNMGRFNAVMAKCVGVIQDGELEDPFIVRAVWPTI